MSNRPFSQQPHDDAPTPRPSHATNGHDDAHARDPKTRVVGDWLAWLDRTLWDAPDDPARGIHRWSKRWMQILQRSFVGFANHKALDSASSLTYSTLLSIVPLLALLMAGLTLFGVQKSVREALKSYPLIQNLAISKSFNAAEDEADGPPGATDVGLPSVAGGAGSVAATTPTLSLAPLAADKKTSSTLDAMATKPDDVLSGPRLVDIIFDFVDNANLQKLGPLGCIGLLWAVMMLLTKIEVSMNRAWSVHRQRAFSRKIADYFHILLVGALILLALTTTTSSKVIGGLQNSMTGRIIQELHGVIPGLSRLEKLLLGNVAYLIIWPAFVIIYAYIPNTTVRWRSAIAGGLVAGTLYQVVQILFIEFSGLIWRRYGTIYGSFAILFVLFLWIYMSWVILLWGGEVCATHQNLRDLRRRRRAWHGLPFERETLALRLASLLAAPMLGLNEDKRPPTDAGALADALHCPPDPLGEMIDLFHDHGLVVQSADDLSYSLARSPESITVLDVLRLVRQGHARHDPSIPEQGTLGIDAKALEPLRATTIGDLARLPLESVQTFRL